MKKHRFATLALAIPLMAGGVCLADTPAPTVGPDGKMVDPHNQADKMTTKRLSKCVGKDVFDQDGKNIGTIKDVVLDGATERVSYVAISYGGVLGMGDKYFAVPWKALETRSVEPDKVFLNLSPDTLKNAPGFDKDHWPDMASATFRDQIDRYYSDNSAKKAAKDMKDEKTQAANTLEKAGPTEKGLLWCRRLSAVLGADVRSPADENLGDIEDLVVDAHTGRVHYAVLAFGGVLGVGDKLFAIPVTALNTKADDEKFVLNITKDHLKDAPGFNKNNWPDFADPQFRNSIDDFYSSPRAAADLKPLH